MLDEEVVDVGQELVAQADVAPDDRHDRGLEGERLLVAVPFSVVVPCEWEEEGELDPVDHQLVGDVAAEAADIHSGERLSAEAEADAAGD